MQIVISTIALNLVKQLIPYQLQKLLKAQNLNLFSILKNVIIQEITLKLVAII